jgi:hypothetical protein
MPLSYAELERFYQGLVARARRRGITCANFIPNIWSAWSMPSVCCQLIRYASTGSSGWSPKPAPKPLAFCPLEH